MPHFMIVLITYINLFNLSWMIKYQFLRNMEILSNSNEYFCREIRKKYQYWLEKKKVTRVM